MVYQRTFSDIGGHINFSLAMQEAYIFALEYCLVNKIEFDYIGKLDGDNIISENFFENLIIRFEADDKLGAASGISYTDGKRDNFPEDELPDKRLYRKDALEQIGGFPDSKYSPDTVILAKMRMAGWKIKAFSNSIITNLPAGWRDNAGRLEYWCNVWESPGIPWILRAVITTRMCV